MTSESAARRDRNTSFGQARSFAFALFLVSLFLLVGVILVSDGRRAVMPLLGPLVNGTYDLLGLSGAVFGFALAMIWSGRAFFTGRLDRWHVKVLGILGVVLSVCGLAGCGGETAGGLVGSLLAGKMIAFTGPFLAVTLFCFLLVGSFMLATNWLFYEEFRVLVKKGEREEAEVPAGSPTPAGEEEAPAPARSGDYPIFRPQLHREGLENQVSPREEAQLQGREERAPEPEQAADPAPAGPAADLAGAGPDESRPLAANLTGRTHSFDEEEGASPVPGGGQEKEEETGSGEPPGGEEPDLERAALAGRAHTFDEPESQDHPEGQEDPPEPREEEAAPEKEEEREPESAAESPAPGQQFLWHEPVAELPRPEDTPPAEPREEEAPEREPEPAQGSSAAAELMGEIEIPRPQAPDQGAEGEPDPELLSRAARLIIESGRASTTILQRKLELDHGTAARLMERLEELGVVGPYRGSLAREILMSREEWEALGVNHRS